MPRSTGPILAVGAITVVNTTIVNGQDMNWKVPVATGIAAGTFALSEKMWKEGTVALAYLALVAVLFVRINPGVPAPTESFVKWIEGQ
jgi:hypothetical protein